MTKLDRFLVMLLICLFSVPVKVSAQVTKNKSDSCAGILKSYSNYWKKDSLAGNGFRELLGYEVLKDCDCSGKKWTQIYDYLGNPDFIYTRNEEIEYRYRLNHFSDDLRHPGTLLLDITVGKDGFITSFVVWEVDN